MKFFACLFALAAFVCIASADKTEKKEGLVGSTYGAPSYSAPAPSYGGSSYSAPPCPKNYLLSCQPNVAPVPCSPGYGGHGSYSEHVPQYILPQFAGLPQY